MTDRTITARARRYAVDARRDAEVAREYAAGVHRHAERVRSDAEEAREYTAGARWHADWALAEGWKP